MSKLLPLTQIMECLEKMRASAGSMACRALLAETLHNVDALIRLEHDAHLREIRRLGT